MSRNPAYDEELSALKDKLSNISASALTALGFGEDAGGEFHSRVRTDAADICDDMLRTYEAKDQDYAADGKPMGNLRTSEEVGVPAWRGVLIRMNDKKNRIRSFASRGTYAVKDESVVDTLIDLANYSLLGLLLFREARHTVVPQSKEAIEYLVQQSYADKIEFAYQLLAMNTILLALLYKYGKEGNHGTGVWNESKPYLTMLGEYGLIADYAKKTNAF